MLWEETLDEDPATELEARRGGLTPTMDPRLYHDIQVIVTRLVGKTSQLIGNETTNLAATNMALKQNAIDNALQYPLAANVVERSFYVDDCLTGADTKAEAMLLQKQLQDLFSLGGFLLRKLK